MRWATHSAALALAVALLSACQGGVDEQSPTARADQQAQPREAMCRSARDLRVSWEAEDARAAAEDARDMSEAADRVGGPVADEAVAVRTAVVAWRDWAEDAPHDGPSSWGPDADLEAAWQALKDVLAEC